MMMLSSLARSTIDIINRYQFLSIGPQRRERKIMEIMILWED